MSTSSRSSKSKSTAKPKSAAKTKSAAAPNKSRLAGPKPPKARASATKTAAPVKPATTPATASTRPSTSKIPAPPAPAKTPLPVELKKPELIDMVVAKSDIKKKYAKPVVEAMLEVLGETLAKGREMNLQPLGKVKYNRTKETTSARVIVAKVRQSKPANKRPAPPNEPLADAAE